jgi:hypothetical protein
MVGLDSFIAAFMLSTKQNVELLTRQYGDARFGSVLRGQITVAPVSATLQQLTAKGLGYDFSGQFVPQLSDYQELLKSVQLLVNDVENMRQTLNALITQIKA